MKDLENVGGFKISRCFKPQDFGQITSAQLHLFSDASEIAYGTVTYLRLQNNKNKVLTTFILGKARVSPLKQVTIPRLEPTAAVFAVKVDKMLRSELQLPLGKVTVLDGQYISIEIHKKMRIKGCQLNSNHQRRLRHCTVEIRSISTKPSR